MEAVDAVELIEEVKKREAIWNYFSDEYANRKERDHAWKEICQVFCSNFNDLDVRDKRDINEYLRNRWKNVRDSFFRDLKGIKKGGKKPNGSLMRRYMHYDCLQFLEEMAEKRANEKIDGPCSEKKGQTNESDETFPECEVDMQTTSSLTEEKSSNETVKNVVGDVNANQEDRNSENLHSSAENHPSIKKVSGNKLLQDESINDYDERKRLPNAGSIKHKEQKSSCLIRIKKKKIATPKDDDDDIIRIIDENPASTGFETVNSNEADKLFLLSLLNDFQKISEDDKSDVKCDILQVLKKYKTRNIRQKCKKKLKYV